MTRVDFYFNAASKRDTALRLAAKAYQAGAHTLLYTLDESLAAALDRDLWTVSQLAFIPHVRCTHPLAGETPVLIGDCPGRLPSRDVLINLDDGPPPGYEAFQRLIEIVCRDEEDRQHARRRYRHYRERGDTIETYDLTEKQP